MKIETDYTKWYVDGLESFEKKSKPKIITTKTGFAQQDSDIQTKVNNDKTDIDTKIVIGPSTQIEKNKKSKKIIARVLICIIITAAIVISALFAKTVISNNSNNNYNDYEDIGYTEQPSETTTQSTTQSTTAAPTQYNGKCGDNATYTISKGSDDMWTLNISGSGELWDDDNVDWQIEDNLIDEIIIYDEVTVIQAYQFSGSPFSAVKRVQINSAVKHIGEGAFGNDSLEEISIDNADCQIDYISDDSIIGTLGYSDSKTITIHCYEDSTADKYATEWNDNYPGTYEIDYY